MVSLLLLIAFTSPEYTQKRVYGLPHESIVVGESKNIFLGKFTVFSRRSSNLSNVFFLSNLVQGGKMH